MSLPEKKTPPTPASTLQFPPSPLEQEVVGLFDLWQGPLLRYLLSLGLSSSDAEEIVQDVFLALFQHLQSGKSRGNLRAWIFQVGHNLALKQRNIARRRRVTLDDGSDFCVNESLNPELRFAANQRQQRLLRVLRALPAQDRRCLSLRAEGLTYREIAQILEISLGSVSLSLARSLARFTRADERC